MDIEKRVFVGLFASASSLNNFSLFTGYLVVENGKITKKGNTQEFKVLHKSGRFEDFKIIILNEDQFLMPGFVDCHTHAPQFPNIGLGLDRPLLQWLAKYTFPLESRYNNAEFAATVYDVVVKRLLHSGTTTACYFGSLHLEGTLELAKSALKHHQRALVGKVSMNLENDAGYFNETKRELTETKSFVEKVLDFKNDLVQPVITPRFAVSCDVELMTGLAKISEQYQCRIQSHLSENKSEIEYVLKINPGCKNYTAVYDTSGLLNKRCIMAHAIYLKEDEIKTLIQKGVSIAHCPASNTRLRSGLCPVKKYLDSGVVVGLGTDVSGGDNATILDAMRRCLDVSMHIELQGSKGASLNWKQVFYLATQGGAEALNLEDKVGTLEINKEFDALLVDVYAPGGPIDKHPYPTYSTEEEKARKGEDLLERFIYLGDDRNIKQVYVKGQPVKI